jgi:outer membrane protein assembly factor BamA
LKGHLFNVNLSRAGLTSKEDIHLTALYTDISLYRPITKKYFYTASLRGKTSSPSKQPYFNYRGFGYGQDYVRGYEYYVIDGQHYGLAKLTLKRELLNIQKHIPQLIPFRQFQTIPIAIYLKLYGDAGYVVDNIYNYENNRFSNTMLYGGGIGIDFVTFYNTVFRIDCSVNRSLERGFFFHFVRDI